jgi:integrase
MPKRKPAGWPRYMIVKRLTKGAVAYYWQPPSWAKAGDCPIGAVALGSDYGAAKERCDSTINPQFDAWRSNGDAPAIGQSGHGTFDWLVAVYKRSPRYINRPAKTRRSYDQALALASSVTSKSGGRRFGEMQVESITPGVADRIFDRLRTKADGTSRNRSAVLSMVICKTAWNVAWRAEPATIPAVNPFSKMQLQHTAKQTRPVTHEELERFVAAADASGEGSVGTAMMIAYYWLQRQTDILGRLAWGHYRPNGVPIVKIRHHKTGAEIDLPLEDEDGTVLWPELTKRLDSVERRGTLIVTRDVPDRWKKTYLPWKEDYFRHRVAEIRSAAGIDEAVKFMGARHGGNTEGADSGLSDAQLRALSGHKSVAMVHLYAKQTMRQRREGARKRLDKRTKGGDLSE